LSTSAARTLCAQVLAFMSRYVQIFGLETSLTI
jgi:hypothetical protein